MIGINAIFIANMSLPPRTGSITDVEHIVILMQENRSFDHYFGTLRGVRGFGDPFPIPVPAPPGQERSVWFQRSAAPPLVAPYHVPAQRAAGTPHTWPDAQLAWNHGILDAWPVHKHNHAMGHYSQAELPFQFALANTFTICDAYHCSVQAGTNPNRVFAWTGCIDPFAQGHGPVIGNSYDNLGFDPDGGYAWTTYPERLQEAGVSWQVYQDLADNYADNPLAGFRSFRAAVAGAPGSDRALKERGMSTRTLDQLRADVLAGALPHVSFIVASAEGSEHPLPSSPAQGAHYTAAVLQALTADPAVWSRTVLLLMFDENDGYFDHAPPPAPPASGAPEAGGSTVTTAGEYHVHASAEETESAALMQRPYGLGPRVPMYVISPWSRGGWVNSQVFDHTSVIRFIERRFGVMEPNISPWRRAVCGDLTSCFDFTRPDDTPFMDALPATAALAAQARLQQPDQVVAAPALPAWPVQQSGTRRSRALPYALQVHDAVGADTIELAFVNHGAQGAVFHVYDKGRLEQAPRRYTVEAGKELRGHWPLAGSYDLWVLGPHGFHRHFRGTAGAAPVLRAAYGAGSIAVALSNPAPVAIDCALGDWQLTLAPGATAARLFALQEAGNWYDLSLRLPALPGHLRRLAGRVETGAHGISDPALGQRLR